jgi:hypothetical protein
MKAEGGVRQGTAGSNRGMIEQAGMPVLLLCVVLLRVANPRSVSVTLFCCVLG